MKKAFLILLIICMLFSLSGCSIKETISSQKQEYIVSAIGFDSDDKQFDLTLEAIIINSENSDAERELRLLNGKGRTIAEAMTDAQKSASQPLLLSHCATVVIGDTVNRNQLSEITDFCRSNDGLALSVMLVSSKNAKSLLECKALSSVAMGYDIMSMTEQLSDRTGIAFKNRLYEIKSAYERKIKVFALPRFEVNEQEYFYNGISVYNDGKQLTKLNHQDTAIYSVMTDTLKKGKILIDGKEISVESSYTVCNFKAGSRLNTVLTLDLRLVGNDNQDKELIKQQVETLFKYSTELSADIFGFGNILYHKQKTAWDTFKENYPKHYKNSALTVVLK